MSPDHYSRLEQGRQHTITEEVLEALSRALRLDDIERAHLRDLAAPSDRRRWARPEPPARADPGMLRLIGTLDHVPSLLLGVSGHLRFKGRENLETGAFRERISGRLCATLP